MNKPEIKEDQYFVKWETHAKWMTTGLCSLMEHQSFVDVAICCGTNTIHAHKCVLAASSQYFREQLEKNLGTEQIIIMGLDFIILKSLIEYMYCGVTNVFHKNLKYTVAAAKLFQLRGLQDLVSNQPDVQYEADLIHIPLPSFLTKKPKYPDSYRPLNTSTVENFNAFKNPHSTDIYMQRKVKRKFVRSEAEKACAKEAAASRLALEALRREIASTPQVGSFVIEESCTETTVENFIPHTEETYIENLNQMDNVSQIQMVNFDDLNNSFVDSQIVNLNKNDSVNNVLQFDIQQNSTKHKLKQILGDDMDTNFEIMYHAGEGNMLSITRNMLHNFPSTTFQYQIVDENGHVRELQIEDQTLSNFEEAPHVPEHPISHSTMINEFICNESNEETNKSTILHQCQENMQKAFNAIDSSEPNYIVTSNELFSEQKTNANINTSPEHKFGETNSFINALENCGTKSNQLYRESILENCDDLLRGNDIISENKEDLKCDKIDTVVETVSENVLSKSSDIIFVNDADVDHIVDITSSMGADCESESKSNYNLKKPKMPLPMYTIDQNLSDLQSTPKTTPKRTRSNFNFKISEDVDNLEENYSSLGDGQFFNVKFDKPRRIMTSRKKK
ncbi:hypothetical protein FQA39_LY17821 [Lamprigera yunnana]|nr:hypothetical protein FQA39_LY17821 [Lamprigera yunnana]